MVQISCLISHNTQPSLILLNQPLAHAKIFCNFNYDCTTMAPPGIKVLIHERAVDCVSWSTHALSGCYIGPNLEHYCSHKIWIPDTTSVFIVKNVSWFPHKLTMTTATITEIIVSPAKDLTAALEQTTNFFLLPPSGTITCKVLFNSIKSSPMPLIQYNYTNILQQSTPKFQGCQYHNRTTISNPLFNFQGYPLQNPSLHLQRCLHQLTNIFKYLPYNKKKHRSDILATKYIDSTKQSPLTSPPSTFKSKPCCGPCFLDKNNTDFVTLNIPAKLQHLVQK